jgi:hypothetical protein
MQSSLGTPLGRRCASLGTLCLVLGILELVYCGQRVIMQLLNSRIVRAERAFLPSGAHPPPAAFYSEAEAFAHRVAPWEIARTVPFMVAALVLLFVARRLREGDLAALGAARQWALAALGVVVVSLLVQIVAIVPATMDYQARIVELLPTPPRGKAPFDVGQFTSSMTMVGLGFGMAFGAVGMSVWPVILYIWAGRLRAEARVQPAAVTTDGSP